jgi:hypothetical protein
MTKGGSSTSKQVMSESKQRDFFKVIEQIKEKIPTTQCEFIKDLNRLAVAAVFRTPEIRFLDWENLTGVLREHIGIIPSEKWECEVLSIVSTHPLKSIMDVYNIKG